MTRQRSGSLGTVAMIALVALAAFTTSAQAPRAAASPSPVATTQAASTGGTAQKVFSEAELASLLAPIALYPDSVVTQILMAATYPLEVVEANRFVQKNSSLKGDALAAEVQKQSWDQSVQGLCVLPDVLKMMDERLDWTQDMGDAFLAQQKEVLEMIQTLRKKAKAEGNLKSDDKMKVTTEAAPAATPASGTQATPSSTTTTEVIVIQSADPEVIYVPTYSPTVVYGSWGYPAYPPYYWPPPVGYPGSGFWYGAAVGISIGFWGGCWDNDVDWHGGDINIDNDINIDRGDRGDARPKSDRAGTTDRSGDRAGATDRSGNRSGASATASDRGGQKWSHNPEHRKGVSYRDNTTATKYDRGSGANAGSREAYRGRTSSGTSDFKAGSASAGTRDISGGSDFRSGSTSAGTRDVGSGSGSRGTSAGTRDMSSSSRGSSSMSSSNRATTSRSSSSFSGMSSGSRASSYSSRGGMSRGGGGGGRRR